jgi:hypothetical protein
MQPTIDRGPMHRTAHYDDITLHQGGRYTTTDGDHMMSWLGDKDAVFGLEMQLPWSRHLLECRKTIEVRSYPLPDELLGRRLYILESQPGVDGVSTLGDMIYLQSSSNVDSCSKCEIRGWCVFGSVKDYTSQDEFQRDQVHHLVSSSSGYSWKEETTKILYGWVVTDSKVFEGVNQSEKEADRYFSAVRRKRSIYQLYKEGN